jgi:hypothetical protein
MHCLQPSETDRAVKRKNGTATREVVKERAKDIGQQTGTACRLRVEQRMVTPLQTALPIITARKTRSCGRDKRRSV